MPWSAGLLEHYSTNSKLEHVFVQAQLECSSSPCQLRATSASTPLKQGVWPFYQTLAHTHTLEEFKLVKISSDVPRETRFMKKLRVSFFGYVLMIVLSKKSSNVRNLTNHFILKWGTTSSIGSSLYHHVRNQFINVLCWWTDELVEEGLPPHMVWGCIKLLPIWLSIMHHLANYFIISEVFNLLCKYKNVSFA